MSLYHENFVWPLDMPALKKLVLCYVARKANLRTALAEVTIRDIAYRCGMSDSALRGCLNELEHDGHITRLSVPRAAVIEIRVNLGEAQCSA
jgi:CTP-dependent riboflavin kinase